jgi:subtilisin family serine protease
MVISTVNKGAQGPQPADSSSYGYEQGTSMAAPLVTGVVALKYAAHPGITFDQFARIIINTATPFNNDPTLTFNTGTPSTDLHLNTIGHCYNPYISTSQADYDKDGRCGSGIVNAGAAVAAALALP